MTVACGIDYEKHVVNFTASANRDISNQKAEEITALWTCLKRISRAALMIYAHSTPSEYHPYSHKISDSPPADKYANEKRT